MRSMTMTLPGGLLVAIDGIDGAGKTTLANALRTQLESAGAAVMQSKEPTTGPWGMKLRESAAAGRLSPDEEVRLLLLDRREHVAKLVRPALDAGKVVILDRYFPSTVAYQGAAGLPVDDLLDANAFAPTPDVLLVLDIAPKVGIARIRARGDAPNHFETPDTLTACRDIFLGLQLPNMHVIDASQPADQVLADAQLKVMLALVAKLETAHGPLVAVQEASRYLAGAL